MHTFMEIVLMSVVLFFVLGGLGFFYVLINKFLSIPSSHRHRRLLSKYRKD